MSKHSGMTETSAQFPALAEETEGMVWRSPTLSTWEIREETKIDIGSGPETIG